MQNSEASVRHQPTHCEETEDIPPTYLIDLSLPPRQRYVLLAQDYKEEINSLTRLFDELVEQLHPSASVKWVKRLARLTLTRLYTREETEEIRGISRATGVEFYLLVAFNVLLDLLMGCTSGAARCKEKGQDGVKMLHFRTLDWGMDPLRKVIVQIAYVRSKSATPKKVLGTSITYVGFVGVLTGVRRNLSMSLNFRPEHETGSRMANFRFYSHHLLVLLGFRRSISSLLRQYLIPQGESSEPASLASLAETLPSVATTAAYLIFSDGATTVTMEKDHHRAVVRSSDSFIVLTNHDLDGASEQANANEDHVYPIDRNFMSFEEAIEESADRRKCMLKHWERKIAQEKKRKRAWARAAQSRSSSTSTVVDSDAYEPSATEKELVKWVITWPTTNECTHFSAIMDASRGKVAWVRRYLVPAEPPFDE